MFSISKLFKGFLPKQHRLKSIEKQLDEYKPPADDAATPEEATAGTNQEEYLSPSHALDCLAAAPESLVNSEEDDAGLTSRPKPIRSIGESEVTANMCTAHGGHFDPMHALAVAEAEIKSPRMDIPSMNNQSDQRYRYNAGQYYSALKMALDNGVKKNNRTGIDTISYFGQMARFDIRQGAVPLPAERKVPYRSFIHEILWFISGSTDVAYLKENNVSIWDEWVKEDTAVYDVDYRGYSTELEKILMMPGDNPRAAMDKAMKVLDDKGSYRKLVSGSIGDCAYGSQWRNKEDTRLIPEASIAEFRERGFAVSDNPIRLRGKPEWVATRQVDQLADAIELLKTNPDSRRIIVMAYDPTLVDDCVLPPCHSAFQFWTRELTRNERITEYFTRYPDMTSTVMKLVNSERPENVPGEVITGASSRNKATEDILELLDRADIPKRAVSCMLYQRSCDLPLGGVFNIAQYSILVHMVAKVVNMVPEEFIWAGADTHIYENQLAPVNRWLACNVESNNPRVILKGDQETIDDFKFEDFEIVGYNPQSAIKIPVAR